MDGIAIGGRSKPSITGAGTRTVPSARWRHTKSPALFSRLSLPWNIGAREAAEG